MTKKFILLAGLFTFFTSRVEANSARVVQELVTIGMNSKSGQEVLAKIIRRPISKMYPNLHRSEDKVKPIVEHLLDTQELEGRPISGEILRELIAADLSSELAGRDLSHGEFEGVSFYKTKISDIKFDQANLSRTNFAESELPGAKFVGTDLSGASLRQVNFDGLDFSGATLSGADLRGNNLNKAKLDGSMYNFKTALPLFFNPKAHNMVSSGGRRYGRYTYFLASIHNRSVLLQCAIGSALGAGSSFFIVSDFSRLLDGFGKTLAISSTIYAIAGPFFINSFMNKSVSPYKKRLISAYSCVLAGGVITGVVL